MTDFEKQRRLEKRINIAVASHKTTFENGSIQEFPCGVDNTVITYDLLTYANCMTMNSFWSVKMSHGTMNNNFRFQNFRKI